MRKVLGAACGCMSHGRGKSKDLTSKLLEFANQSSTPVLPYQRAGVAVAVEVRVGDDQALCKQVVRHDRERGYEE